MVDNKFFDSLIFFSLIITFALILLLVYYFKQRISALEQRSDSLFDIINSLVKQMQLMQAAPQHLGEKSTPENASIRAYDNKPHYMQQYITSTPVSENNCLTENNYLTENIYLEKADDESLDDSSEEETDSESDNEEESVSDYNLESESDDEPLPELETTKIIHVDLPETTLESIPSSSTDEIESLGDDDIQIPEDIILDATEIPIVVNKLELDATEMSTEDNGSSDANGSTIEHYKKWALPALRTLVISKGLVSDASKLKKNEILKLLSEEQP
jgi:hypothetical protein